MNDAANPKKNTNPFRLIFWGVLVCVVDWDAGGFDILNDFIGMLMILWGVAALSLVTVSKRYRRGMALVVVMTALSTVLSFYFDFLAPLIPMLPTWSPRPSAGFFAAFFGGCLIFLCVIIVFYRCMMEFCAAQKWENSFDSWGYSTRLLTRGVALPFAVLSIPLFIHFTSLEFVPKNSKITSVSQTNGDETQVIVSRDGEVVHTYTAPIGATISWSHSDFEPSSNGWTIGNWVAPHVQIYDAILKFCLIVCAIFFFWAFIHFLITLSPMIRVVDQWHTHLKPSLTPSNDPPPS